MVNFRSFPAGKTRVCIGNHSYTHEFGYWEFKGHYFIILKNGKLMLRLDKYIKVKLLKKFVIHSHSTFIL